MHKLLKAPTTKERCSGVLLAEAPPAEAEPLCRQQNGGSNTPAVQRYMAVRKEYRRSSRRFFRYSGQTRSTSAQNRAE